MVNLGGSVVGVPRGYAADPRRLALAVQMPVIQHADQRRAIDRITPVPVPRRQKPRKQTSAQHRSTRRAACRSRHRAVRRLFQPHHDQTVRMDQNRPAARSVKGRTGLGSIARGTSRSRSSPARDRMVAAVPAPSGPVRLTPAVRPSRARAVHGRSVIRHSAPTPPLDSPRTCKPGLPA